jgi:iron(III) transport system ATP-binding protein
VLLPGVVASDRVSCFLGTLSLTRPCRPGAAEVLIRPEQIRLTGPDAGRPAIVESVTYYGHDCSVMLVLEGLPAAVTALVPGHASPSVGDLVGLHVDGDVIVYPVSR